MNKTELLNFLSNSQIQYILAEHEAAKTIEEIDSFNLPNAEYIVKNLFLRDDKKRNYYLIISQKDKTINLKTLRINLGTRPLSFASEDDLLRFLALPKGSVTPLGILNDETHSVQVIMDNDVFSYPLVGVHPNENTATVWLSPNDLKRIIEEHGNPFLTAVL